MPSQKRATANRRAMKPKLPASGESICTIDNTDIPMEVVNLVIRPPKRHRVLVTIRAQGNAPVVHHEFSEKAKKQIANSQKGDKGKSKAHEPRDPISDWAHSVYLFCHNEERKAMRDSLIAALRKAKVQENDDVTKIMKKFPIGIPARCIKKSIISACRNTEFKMSEMKQWVHILPDTQSDWLVQMDFDKVLLCCDPVRLAGQSSGCDLRYRMAFYGWQAQFLFQASPKVSMQEYMNLIQEAGDGAGLMENRPEKGGTNGRFRIIDVGNAA